MTTLRFLCVLSCYTAVVNAFVLPATFLVRDVVSLQSLPDMASFLLAADADTIMSMSPGNEAVSAVTEAVGQVQGGGGGIVDTITSVLSGITAIAFFLFGLTYVLAAWIIPQAAAQLEEQTKELDPDLWDEYQAKLDPGQTLDQRPDLMQELGDKVQKVMAEKFDEMGGIAKEQAVENEDFLNTMDAQATNAKKSVDTSQVMDAEIVSEDDEPEQKTIIINRDDDPWSE
mmetsp:Transcript_564/g.932  ORF Transcript_564/g.932 Transcript_564/m.932 type:complete len:229 (-) Transcript_564:9-695(-)|eukprot:CAMPEP_0119005422 /NCGR_PEP_ID=MMETSP1176-20130426/1714_1 /TAXON_ID=265551 /ORGANISM="Synedropsis recta cf, Strain CCMP1620" /LENGTH=228 /DNA_ID=CAMNT_0006957229 /DNA_START=32 /DNA_END=718 /DNA_ORIENTATION=+